MSMYSIGISEEKQSGIHSNALNFLIKTERYGYNDIVILFSPSFAVVRLFIAGFLLFIKLFFPVGLFNSVSIHSFLLLSRLHE